MNWIRLLAISCIYLLSIHSLAAETPVRLETPNTNIHDRSGLIRGAQFYKQYCLVCHTLQYMKHDPIAKEVGVASTEASFNKEQWNFQITPPDLSLVVRRRGAPWVYTYLLSFYKDPDQPNNTNNLVLHNTQMPNILSGLHGSYRLIANYNALDQYGSLLQKPAWYNVLEKTSSGSVDQAMFEADIEDLVTFLAYASDPKAIKRHHIGIGVLIFLVLLLILAILLKREYWKDIKR